MGSSLKKKRRIRSSSSTVKVGRVKKQKQTVKVTPVLFPGASNTTGWDQDTTHQLNYENVGISSDPNKVGKTGRNSQKLDEPKGGGRGGETGGADGDGAENDGKKKKKRPYSVNDGTVAGTAVVGGDEVRGAMGQRRSTGLAPPKQLTTKQRRIVGALVEKHGHDIAAMSRDIKLNKMQHTVAKLRELVVSYVAYPELLQEGGGYLGFRAPKKRSLKSRF